MARRDNELFIGKQYINTEGRTIKHPGLIKKYATMNPNKTSDKRIEVIGTDIETNHLTGELKLLGLYDGKNYNHYTSDFLHVLFDYVRKCKKEGKSLAYWNRLDPFIITKQFFKHLTLEQQYRAIERFGKVSGEWNKDDGTWEITPVIEVSIGSYRFGIKNAIRSSLQLYYYDINNPEINIIWAYDIASLYPRGLEAEAARFGYYSKVHKSAHLVDWDRYNKDKDYRENIVLKSNYLDARACYDLALHIQEDFKNAFEFYPKTLISQGSLARSAIVATLHNQYKDKISGKKELKKKVSAEFKSIGIMSHYDGWVDRYGGEIVKDLYCLTAETYSGGYIESIRYGHADNGWYADIASAYPGTIQNLLDLRGAKIITGTGQPPSDNNSYIFVRGVVSIPKHVNFHSITVKHMVNKDTNIRAVGTYRASYTSEEREFLKGQGASFKDESWYQIKTTGKKSALANVCMDFIDLRAKLKNEGNSSEHMAKIAANSLYGILFEAVDTYTEDDDLLIHREGYRAGEFWNPIYAAIITSRTRILMATAATAIEKNGGKVILLMTDSITWQGTKDMIPPEIVRDKKTLGYYETPEQVSDIICLGSGRYSFRSQNGKYTTKKRGLNASSLHDPDGIIEGNFNWKNALKLMDHYKTEKLQMKVRVLISPGIILHNHKYEPKDLGLIVDDERKVDAVVGKSKRWYDPKIKNPKLLATQLLDTKPIEIRENMLGKIEIIDRTLPFLRGKTMEKTAVTRKDNRRKNVRNANNTYRSKNKDKINHERQFKYQLMRSAGISVQEATNLKNQDMENVLIKIREVNDARKIDFKERN